MSVTEYTAIPPDVLADMQAVADHLASGKPLAPELAARVASRSKQAQDELLRTFGVREIAVDLIREVRDEE